MEDYITLIQPAPDGLESAVPLVLIHDGGGTSVSYYYLDSLNRTVYGIQNPHFESSEPWEDGIPEMGRIYAKLIQSVIPSGPILLGGWSLGGVLSMEVASVLAKSSTLRVVGMVMIDSIYTHAHVANPRTIVPRKQKFGAYAKPETQVLVSKSMDMAVSMTKSWVCPVWNGCSDPTEYSRRANLEKELSVKMRAKYANLLSDSGSEITEKALPPIQDLPPPPPTVLLRCNQYVPVSAPDVSDPISRVDLVRECEKLGWDQYNSKFIVRVLDIPGHHFNIFDDEHVDELGSRIKLACRVLERVSI